MNKVKFLVISLFQNGLVMLDSIRLGYLRARQGFARDMVDLNNARILESRKVFKRE